MDEGVRGYILYLKGVNESQKVNSHWINLPNRFALTLSLNV